MLDTGSKLTWQHLHATNLNDLTGILQWMGDQHGGQAKGLGLHLHIHIYRNIKMVHVKESVKKMMRSLVCMEHLDFTGTMEKIEQDGGKPGVDWVQDKVQSQFTLAAMCWEKCFIPRVVWQNDNTNSNIIEALHSDVNSEGVHCSLVCGVKKGLQFDLMKSQSLKVWSGQFEDNHD
ncbi:hypothetical protein PAXRUDRAFT_34935 [Paxillus rubicundulus Ve08.2h10]|uniref:Uncharacterized protein n=1 Tax=Paxillus rubicundulus Ve08.2h10 TaxID=930991 RepID=A0A0D0DK11_9AGAM|nr:hypothetical protein PAXRUDRAFT_34935 [Paxillus rubicundulus Ve08.2h10]